MAKRTRDVKALEAEYKGLMATASTFSAELAKQLSYFLEGAGVALAFPIQWRVKRWESLAEKFRRLAMPMKTLREIQDLVGLRIILLFRRDAAKVDAAITKALRIVRVYDTGERLKEDQFGYSSRHYIVGLPQEWAKVPTFAGMEDLIAEIQVRTLAQHMWAEASHVLQYKREDTVPASIRRALYRGSAILEIIDLEFDRILNERDTYRKDAEIRGSVEPLNVDLLEKILDEELPSENKTSDEPYAELLLELAHFHIVAPSQLQTLIRKRLKDVQQEERTSVARVQQELATGKQLTGTDTERAKCGVYFSHVGWVRIMLVREFGEDKLMNFWGKERTKMAKKSAPRNASKPDDR